jgi:hypothetical protein
LPSPDGPISADFFFRTERWTLTRLNTCPSQNDYSTEAARAPAGRHYDGDMPTDPKLIAQINAAPEPLRSYILWLEIDANPAGTLQDLWACRQNERALAVLLEQARARIAALEGDPQPE